MFNWLKIIKKSRRYKRPLDTVVSQRRLITEAEVASFAHQSLGLKYMCKNCGTVHDTIHKTRTDEDYCQKCKWLICNNCRSNGVRICGNCEAAG